MEQTMKELHATELNWDEVLPESLLKWLDVFSSAHNVVKDIMFPGILTAISGLMAPKTTLQISEMEFEPVNLFTIVLAPPGAGKSSALHAGVVNPIIPLEETTDKPLLVEDFTRSGVFVHLRATDGLGVYAKDEVHVVMKKMVANGKNTEIDKDLLIKFFDNAQWTVNKGNTAKRDRVLRTGVAFFGLSQPDSFFNIYEKMSKKGNGLVDRILCCCPRPLRLTRVEVNAKVRQLQQYEIHNLESVYEHIFHRHNDAAPVVYTLSPEAFTYFAEKEKELVEAQNKIFSGGPSSDHLPHNISKAAKLFLRMAVTLHVFTDQMLRSLGMGSTTVTPTIISVTTMKRAFSLGSWFLDNRNILEKIVSNQTSPDSFGTAKKGIQAPGPFVTTRMMCRLAHTTASAVMAAMEKLEKEKLGKANQELNCFFKQPPIHVKEENLELYGMDIISYTDEFRKRNGLSNNQWSTLLLNAPHQVEVARYFTQQGH